MCLIVDYYGKLLVLRVTKYHAQSLSGDRRIAGRLIIVQVKVCSGRYSQMLIKVGMADTGLNEQEMRELLNDIVTAELAL